METKTCSLTEDEIRALIKVYANELTEDNIDETIDRMNYLNKRLNAKPKEEAPKAEAQPVTEQKVASW